MRATPGVLAAWLTLSSGEGAEPAGAGASVGSVTPEAEAAGMPGVRPSGAGGPARVEPPRGLVEGEEQAKEKEKWCFQRQRRSRQGQRPWEPWGVAFRGADMAGPRHATGRRCWRGRAEQGHGHRIRPSTLGIGTVLVQGHARSRVPGVGQGRGPGGHAALTGRGEGRERRPPWGGRQEGLSSGFPVRVGEAA